jgi:hypothetical protein
MSDPRDELISKLVEVLNSVHPYGSHAHTSQISEALAAYEAHQAQAAKAEVRTTWSYDEAHPDNPDDWRPGTPEWTDRDVAARGAERWSRKSGLNTRPVRIDRTVVDRPPAEYAKADGCSMCGASSCDCFTDAHAKAKRAANCAACHGSVIIEHTCGAKGGSR